VIGHNSIDSQITQLIATHKTKRSDEIERVLSPASQTHFCDGVERRRAAIDTHNHFGTALFVIEQIKDQKPYISGHSGNTQHLFGFDDGVLSECITVHQPIGDEPFHIGL
jgi:hypothetical protein